MTTFLENIGLIVMLSIAVAALVRFPARRYLIVVISGTAIGAWLMGYALGARSAAETAYSFVPPDQVGQAKALIEANLLSPLWGLAIGLFIVLLGYVVFRTDARKNLRRPPEANGLGDHGRGSPASAIGRSPRKKSSPSHQPQPTQLPDGA